jgi:DNA-binding transcriptional ArsR family regulator
MSIAQRFVAGEGETHPEDSDALRAFRCDSVNLPWVIFRAAFRASHVDDLPQRARSVLAAVARTVDAAKPYADIFARRELLTGRAMQSMRTFYRSLDDLENAGLIERRPQSRYVEAGLFGRAYLRLTEKTALLLGLVEPPSPCRTR